MRFLNRGPELERLDRLARSPEGGLAVVHGRRRVGKTRLLLEWVERHGGVYAVADLSDEVVLRRNFAGAMAARLPGFDEVEYRDWGVLLSRLAREAQAIGFRGPIVIDELPYLVLASPELPSVLQRFVDHEARRAALVVGVAGSSQRTMQGLVLSADAPLFGRAKEILEVRPLAPRWLPAGLGAAPTIEQVRRYACWGGVPRYWELARELRGSVLDVVDQLVLDPLGVLHHEPDRLILEETPSALEVRPLLDAIGAGAHRLSEIGGRLQRPATSLSRPLGRLVGMGIVRREVPFGEPARSGKKSLYRIDDPFFRLWFRVVAPNRSRLAVASKAGRKALAERLLPGLYAEAWEELCRSATPGLGEWDRAQRWWSGTLPEWDVVAESADGRRVLLGEAKWSDRPFDDAMLDRAMAALVARPAPEPVRGRDEIERVLFVPELARGVRPPSGRHAPGLVTGTSVLSSA